MSAKKKQPRTKHIPQRTCVGCRQVHSKRELIRIVRTHDGVSIEADERLSGRGAYLHTDQSCWKKGIPAALANALRTSLSEEDLERLQSFIDTLPKTGVQESFANANV